MAPLRAQPALYVTGGSGCVGDAMPSRYTIIASFQPDTPPPSPVVGERCHDTVFDPTALNASHSMSCQSCVHSARICASSAPGPSKYWRSVRNACATNAVSTMSTVSSFGPRKPTCWPVTPLIQCG